MISQLWHVGRISDPELLDGALPVAPSALKPKGFVSLLRPKREFVVPRALETEEIPGIVADFKRGAENAKQAGFDGAEVHGANGYLIDQFLQDSTNRRTDRYGGAVGNRARFLLEIVDAVTDVWGAGRVGVHLNTRGLDHDMGDSDPGAIFGHVADELRNRRIAFIFVREKEGPGSLLGEIKRRFAGPVIANDTMSVADAERLVESGTADAVSFGKAYIANPDLAKRIASGAPMNTPDATTFYTDGPEGYTDYPALAH